MVDRPKLDPQVFSKRSSQGVPRLTAQTPNFRAAPSVSSFASESVADSLVSMADDAKRLQAMHDEQFQFDQQQFEIVQSEVEEKQRLEAEEQFSKAEVLFSSASQSIIEQGDADSVLANSVEAYDKISSEILNTADLSKYQVDYLNKRFSEGRNAVSLSATKQQIAIRQAEKAASKADAQRGREVTLFRTPTVEKFLELSKGADAGERSELSQVLLERVAQENPDKAQELLDSKLFDSSVDGDKLIDFQGIVSSEKERKLRVSRSYQKQIIDNIKDDIKDYSTVSEKGKYWQGRDGTTEAQLEARIKASGDAGLYQDFIIARDDARFARSVSSAGLPEIEAASRSFDVLNGPDKPVTARELKRQEIVKDRLADMRTRLRSPDAMSLGDEQGIIQSIPVNLNNTATLLQRAKDHKAVANHNGVHPSLVPMLRPLEKDELIRELKVPDDSAFLEKASSLNSAFETPDLNNVLRQISKEAPAYSIAVPLSKVDPAASRAIHRGSIARVESGGNIRVNANLFTESFDKAVGEALSIGGEKGDAAYYNAVTEAVKSYLVGTDTLPASDGGYTNKEVKAGVEAILGEVAYEGVWAADRMKTFAPLGVSASDFEDNLNNISMDDFKRAVGGTPVAADGAEIPIEELRDRAQYRYRANGLYFVEFKSGNRSTAITIKETGEPAKFYYNRMLNK